MSSESSTEDSATKGNVVPIPKGMFSENTALKLNLVTSICLLIASLFSLSRLFLSSEVTGNVLFIGIWIAILVCSLVGVVANLRYRKLLNGSKSVDGK